MGSSRGWHKGIGGNPPAYNWECVRTVAGVKVLKHKTKPNASLPTFSNTPGTMYLKENSTGKIDQLRIFVGRHSYIDIDWGHPHKGIPRGVAHVESWKYDPKTKEMKRSSEKRLMSRYMIKKYGDIIKAANPNVKWE